MGNKIYADMKFYENKLNNIMQKLDVQKFYYKWTKEDAYIKFKYKNKWYQFTHTLDNANKTRPKNNLIVYGSDIFAQLVLTLENLCAINEYNICIFENWIKHIEIKYDNEIPKCFSELGFKNNLIPKQSVVNNKISELKSIMGPCATFYSKENYEKLLELEKECNEYYINKEKSD